MGDFAAKRHPHHGRIFACQFSVAIGIPFSLLILKVSNPVIKSNGHASDSTSDGWLGDTRPQDTRYADVQGLPANGNAETVYLYAVVLVIFGCLKSWVRRPCVHRSVTAVLSVLDVLITVPVWRL